MMNDKTKNYDKNTLYWYNQLEERDKMRFDAWSLTSKLTTIFNKVEDIQMLFACMNNIQQSFTEAEVQEKEFEKTKKRFDEFSSDICFERSELKKELDELKKPPTQEEVCEALSKYLNRKVTYYNKTFYYQFRNELGKVYFDEYFYTLNDNPHAVNERNYIYSLNVDTPLRILSMVVRFYEGVEQHD